MTLLPFTMIEMPILQTRFGLKTHLWARWTGRRTAQVHDGSREIATLEWSPHNGHNKTPWLVCVYDLTQPVHSYRVNMTVTHHSTPDKAWGRMTRQAAKAWETVNPTAFY